MRFDKLVEMVKRVGRERLEENHHSTRYHGSKRMSGRYKPGVKLAQEALKDKAANKGNPEIDLNPTVNSIDQTR